MTSEAIASTNLPGPGKVVPPKGGMRPEGNGAGPCVEAIAILETTTEESDVCIKKVIGGEGPKGTRRGAERRA
jgi:hypothetical protein